MAAKRKKTKTLRVKKKSSTPVSTVIARRVVALLIVVAFIGGLGILAVKGAQAVGRFLFSGNPQFTIREVEISSDGQLPTEWLQRQADVGYGDNLFAVKPKAIRRELKRVPKIQAVSVKRQLPDQLIIDVKERFAVAQISFKAKNRYPQTIDQFGVVMAPSGRAGKLPLIYGVPEFEDQRNLRPGTNIKASALDCALEVLKWCNTSRWGAFVEVASIDASYQDFIRVYLADNTLVYVPQIRPNVLRGKLLRLANVLQIAREEGSQLAHVDLRSDGINVPTKPR
ncbi:cell division protein FtsQ/DivIB [Verrucomicrobiota bacterium]